MSDGLVSPYEEAWRAIHAKLDATTSIQLAKLLLSLQTATSAYSIRECLGELPEPETELALRVVTHWVHFGGHRSELAQIGQRVSLAYPDLAQRNEAVIRYTCLDEVERALDALAMGAANAAALRLNHILERARIALDVIVKFIRENPGSGHTRRLMHFLAGVYNGQDHPFDLTDLRILDDRLAQACLDYLDYDRLGKRKVHDHLPGGAGQLRTWLNDYTIRPQARLRGNLALRLWAMAARMDIPQNDLLASLVEPIIATNEQRSFGLLSVNASESEESVVHVCRPHARTANAQDGATSPNVVLGDVLQPACGAHDGPWAIVKDYAFNRLNCPPCLNLVLSGAGVPERTTRASTRNAS